MADNVQAQIVDHLRRIQTEGDNKSENFVIFNADNDKNYYIQFSVESTDSPQGKRWDSLYAEAVSNEYLEPEHQLWDAQTQKLASLGWEQPDQTSNYYQNFQAATDQDRAEIAELVIRTFVEVYGFSRYGRIVSEVNIG